jgi:hypothetical protein
MEESVLEETPVDVEREYLVCVPTMVVNEEKRFV